MQYTKYGLWTECPISAWLCSSVRCEEDGAWFPACTSSSLPSWDSCLPLPPPLCPTPWLSSFFLTTGSAPRWGQIFGNHLCRAGTVMTAPHRKELFFGWWLCRMPWSLACNHAPKSHQKQGLNLGWWGTALGLCPQAQLPQVSFEGHCWTVIFYPVSQDNILMK